MKYPREAGLAECASRGRQTPFPARFRWFSPSRTTVTLNRNCEFRSPRRVECRTVRREELARRTGLPGFVRHLSADCPTGSDSTIAGTRVVTSRSNRGRYTGNDEMGPRLLGMGRRAASRGVYRLARFRTSRTATASRYRRWLFCTPDDKTSIGTRSPLSSRRVTVRGETSK